MSVLQQKLVNDFFEAHEIGKLIIKKQLNLDPGVGIFKDMIDFIVNDIGTLDKKTYDELNSKISELNKTNISRKEKIKNTTDPPQDSFDNHRLNVLLLMEDYRKYHHILNIIQNLCYKKGWFD